VKSKRTLDEKSEETILYRWNASSKMARQQNLSGGKGLYFNQLSEEVSVDACRKANNITR